MRVEQGFSNRRSSNNILKNYSSDDNNVILFDDLLSDFVRIRKKTIELFKPLKVEDAVVQSSNFGSPPNWHLAHVTWFFQKVLEKHGINTYNCDGSISNGD